MESPASDDSSDADDYSEEDKRKIAAARAAAYASRAKRQEHQAQQASELTALLFGGGGALADLALPPDGSFQFASCAKCKQAVATPRVCSACLAVCYCSDTCLRTDMHHSRLCRLWKDQALRDVAVCLPDDPAWVDVCMRHAGQTTDRLEILCQLGLQDDVAYRVACGCDVEKGDGNVSLSLSACTDQLRASQEPTQPRSWADYYAARGLPSSSRLALLMSFPLTLYHVLASVMKFEAAQPQATACDEALCVHLLGAELREIALAPLLRELSVLMPATKLSVVMIGPAIRQAVQDAARLGARVPNMMAEAEAEKAAGDGGNGGASGGTKAPTPFLAFDGSSGGHVALSVWHGSYDRGCVRALGAPHCAIALNAGLGTTEYHWNDAIDALADARTPFIATDYYETGLWVGSQPSVAGGKLEPTHPIELNPFRQPMVWPESTGRQTALPWMCNGFLCGFNTEPTAEDLLQDAASAASEEEGDVVSVTMPPHAAASNVLCPSAADNNGRPEDETKAVAGVSERAYDEALVASISMGEVLHDNASIDRSGGRVWRASEELAAWVARYCQGAAHEPQPRGHRFASAIELGAGVGLASIALAKLGVAKVVCTDGEPSLLPLCRANAARNGISPEQLHALEFRWDDANHMERVLDAVGSGGRCSELIVASDVLYHVDESGFQMLEDALRALIRRGGCRLVVICNQVRNYNEDRFLPRLADLGRVRVAWRSHGLPVDDACPPMAATDDSARAWRARHSMTWAVSVLELDGATEMCDEND